MFRLILHCVLVVVIVLTTSIGLVKAAPDEGVVGDGTPGSCTEGALNMALAGGGTITFNCGGPKTITLTSVKTVAQNTGILGGNVITLTGNFATRLFSVNSAAQHDPMPATSAQWNLAACCRVSIRLWL